MNKVTCKVCKGVGCARCCWKGWYTVKDRPTMWGSVSPISQTTLTEIKRLYFEEGLGPIKISKMFGVTKRAIEYHLAKWKKGQPIL